MDDGEFGHHDHAASLLQQAPVTNLKRSTWTVATESNLLNSYCSRSEDPAIAASFAADEDRARQLACLLSHSVEWQPTAGSEAMTANAVNQILINVLQGIDRCVCIFSLYNFVCAY